MNKNVFSYLLVGLMGMSLNYSNSKAETKVEDEALVVRNVLRANETDGDGEELNNELAPEANNFVSDVLAQVNTPENDDVNIRFVAGIDTYTYDYAAFNITLKDADGEVVKEERAYEVTSAYSKMVLEGEEKTASEVFEDEKYNYIIAFTLNDVPEDYWNYEFDVTATVAETDSTNTKTKVIGNMLDYNVKVNMFDVATGEKIGSRYEKVELNTVYTVNAPVVEGKVASHDYVKGYLTEGKDTYDIYYSELDEWDGTSVSTAFEGEGTEDKPYLINSGADLAYLQNQVTSGNAFSNQYFKLTKSINVNNHNLNINEFEGIFEGNNCSVRGLNISRTVANTGLFNTLKSGGEIRNLALYGNITGADSTGAIAGVSNGLIKNCTSYVTITGKGLRGGLVGKSTSIIENCVNYGDVNVNTSGWVSGGIAAQSLGQIINCVNFGNVKGTSTDNAGICGSTDGKIVGCTNYGNVSDATYGAAGIVSTIDTTTSLIDDCKNYGNVLATGGQVGGIVAKGNGTISNCDNYGEITSLSSTGGIVGEVKSGSVIALTECTNRGKVNGSNQVGGIVGKIDWTGAGTNNISNCDNYGEVNATNYFIGGIFGSINVAVASECDNYGKVTTTNDGNVGGIAGIVYGAGVLINCENHGEITAPKEVAGIAGKNDGGTLTNCDNYGKIVATIPDGAKSGIAAVTTKDSETGADKGPITDCDDFYTEV